MMIRLLHRLLLPALVAVFLLSPWAAYAQSTSMMTITNAAGYQFQVPADWLTLPASNPASAIVAPPDKSALVTAFAFTGSSMAGMSAPAVATLAMTAAEGVEQSPALGRSGYTAGTPSLTQVTGTDTALSAMATYADGDGTPMNEYLLVAVRGTTAYVLASISARPRTPEVPRWRRASSTRFRSPAPRRSGMLRVASALDPRPKPLRYAF